MTGRALSPTMPAGHASLRHSEVAWLATAVFVVSAGCGALPPVLPGWLMLMLGYVLRENEAMRKPARSLYFEP